MRYYRTRILRPLRQFYLSSTYQQPLHKLPALESANFSSDFYALVDHFEDSLGCSPRMIKEEKGPCLYLRQLASEVVS